jgi:hypothetical protein
MTTVEIEPATLMGYVLMLCQLSYEQCWKMSGNASSTAARKFLTKYLPRKFSYTLQEIFVILYMYTGMAYT